MARYTFAKFACLALVLTATVLPAQESEPPPADEGSSGGAASGMAGEDYTGAKTSAGPFIFPLHEALMTAADGRIVWRPDWPAGIPVDTFDVPGWAERVLSVELSGGGFNLTASLDDSGALVRFPVLLYGEFCQVEARYDSAGRIGSLAVGADGEDPAGVEFLAYENADGQPSLARIHGGGEWFFASINFQNGSIIETWYDAGGNALAVFTTRFADGLPRSRSAAVKAVPADADGADDGGTDEAAADASEDFGPNGRPSQTPRRVVNPLAGAALDFDSMGNVTRIDWGDRVFEAVYAGTEPHYWKTQASLALQWDGEGRLVRMTGTDTADAPLDYRYEYDVDERGAWTERREFRMTAELDALIPVAGDSFRRRIEYR